jgi:Ras-related protein Rab-1A
MSSVGTTTRDYDALYKMIIIGNSGVGKSAIMIRRCDKVYSDVAMSTLGVDFRYSVIEIDKKIIKLQIWDTAGQDRFKTITSTYYRGIHGVIVTYDITNRVSFKKINYWIDEFKNKAIDIQNTVIFLVGNKCDQEDKRKVSFEEGKKYADDNNFVFFEVSAKENINIDKLFFQIAREMDRIGSKQIKKESIILHSPPKTMFPCSIL